MILEFAQNADLTTFLHKYVPNAKQGTSFTCTPVDGGLCSQGSPRDNIREANLDSKYPGHFTTLVTNINICQYNTLSELVTQRQIHTGLL